MSGESESIKARVVEFLRVHGLLTRGSGHAAAAHLLVAASGGRDSTVLAHLMARIGAEWNTRVTLGTVHHGLRDEAEEEVRFVERLGATLGAGVLVRRVDVLAEMRRAGGTIQTAARRVRYAALEEMRIEAGASVILTAHHADDQAETLLAHFLRGAGPDGLTGIRAVHGHVARPLLGIDAADIAAYATTRQLEWIEDASNATDAYRRNAIRHRISPAIADVYGPGWVRTLGDTARLNASLSDFLRQVARARAREAIVVDGDDVLVRRISLNDSSEFEKLMVCRLALRMLLDITPGFGASFDLAALIGSSVGTTLQLRDGVTARNEADGLRLSPAPVPRDAVHLHLGESVRWGAWTFTSEDLGAQRPAFDNDSGTELVDLESIGVHWRLREWTHEDRFEPLGAGREKGVGPFLTAAGLPRIRRGRIPVLEGPSGIIWVCGVRLAHAAALRPRSRHIGRLRFFINEHTES
ncbi:MAG: tRNA lysidine(34) synthetase TilS [Bacteroidota bacterium]|jgi:tRNA(Ile)-lysidine synthase|nr:tRNA lysidine(34) synthetase TilS [Bacteroidota bacterium]